MLPNPRFRSRPAPAADSGSPAAERVSPSFSRVAEAQRVTPANMDAFVEQLPLGVLLVDRDGRVVYANAAARALRVEWLEPVQWAVTRALLTEDAVREDEIQVSAPGEPARWLSAQVLPLRVTGLGVNAAFVTVSNVTASHRLSAWTPVIETLVNL